MKTPITKEKIQNHLHYSSWKYILLAVVAIFGWNLYDLHLITDEAYGAKQQEILRVNM